MGPSETHRTEGRELTLELLSPLASFDQAAENVLARLPYVFGQRLNSFRRSFREHQAPSSRAHDFTSQRLPEDIVEGDGLTAA